MRALLVSLCLLLFALAAWGQTSNGTITGTITDPGGAVVPAAPVEVKNAETGAVYRVSASATGNFTVPVPAGSYELSVTVMGFKKYVRTNLTVAVAADTRQDVTLEVGSATETVTVSEAAPLLKTESGDVSYNITYDNANQLPIFTLGGTANLGNIRNPLAVTNLLPGAVFTNDSVLRINGMPSSSQSIRIEGQDATNGIWRQQNQNNQVSTDAIQEVAIQTSNFAAEYGQAAISTTP